MSTTSTPTVNSAITGATTKDTLVRNLKDAMDRGASGVPAVAAEVAQLNPALKAKALIASKSPWGTLAVSAVAWVSARYGLGWDDTTCNLIAGAGVLLGAYLMRYVTTAPIGGIVSKGTPT